MAWPSLLIGVFIPMGNSYGEFKWTFAWTIELKGYDPEMNPIEKYNQNIIKYFWRLNQIVTWLLRRVFRGTIEILRDLRNGWLTDSTDTSNFADVLIGAFGLRHILWSNSQALISMWSCFYCRIVSCDSSCFK